MFVTKSTVHCAVVQRSLEVSKNVLTLCKTSIAPRTLFLSTFRSCLLPCLKIFFLIHAAYSQVSETKVKEFSLFTEPLLISIKEWFIFYLSFNDRHFDRCPSKSASKLRKTSTHLKLGAVSILRTESFRKLSRLTK